MAKHYKQIDLSDKSIIKDAVELQQMNFIEVYEERGYGEVALVRAWFDLRRTEHGKELMDKYYKKKNLSISHTGEPYKAMQSTNADIIAIHGKSAIGKKKQTKREKQGGSRLDQVRQLVESGMTSSTKIAKEIGANPSYVNRLIKQL